jgi:hypothetical protein
LYLVNPLTWEQRKCRYEATTISTAPVHPVHATQTILEGAARMPSVLVRDR